MPQRLLPRRTIHSIVEIPVRFSGHDAEGYFLPLLILKDGEICKEAFAFSLNQRNTGATPSTVYKKNQAIGRFYDYYFLYKKGSALLPHELPVFLRQFRNARFHGCKELNWPASGDKTSSRDMKWVTEFTNFCAQEFGHQAFNPSRRIHVSQADPRLKMRWRYQTAQRRQGFFAHLDRFTQHGQGFLNVAAIDDGDQKRKKGKTVCHPFPEKLVEDFINRTPSIRDKLCWILLFFGGIRYSELLHIFISDVSWDFEKDEPRVILADPEEGKIDVPSKSIPGEWVTLERRVYLKENFGLHPRNRLGATHPLHAGWKSMLYDDAEKGHARVYWISSKWAKEFYRLHQIYIRQFRSQAGPAGSSHPYYFINTNPSDPEYGRPLKLGTVKDRWKDACGRLNLKCRRAEGTNLHGARHYYGFFLANRLHVPIETAQQYTHHLSLASTKVYYTIDPGSAHDSLKEKREAYEANRR